MFKGKKHNHGPSVIAAATAAFDLTVKELERGVSLCEKHQEEINKQIAAEKESHARDLEQLAKELDRVKDVHNFKVGDMEIRRDTHAVYASKAKGMIEKFRNLLS